VNFNKLFFCLLYSFSLPAFALSSTEIVKQLEYNAAHHPIIKQVKARKDLFTWELWSKPHGGQAYLQTQQIPHSDVLFAYNPYKKFAVFRSQDAGKSWSALDSLLSMHELVNIDDHTLLAISGSRIYLSKDQGEHWSPSSMGIPQSSFYVEHAYVVSPKIIYLSDINDQKSYYSKIYRSMDGGASWEPAILGLNANHGVQAFNAKDNLALAIQDTKNDNVSELYLSTNNGAFWKKVRDINAHSYSLHILINSKNEVFIQGDDNLYQTNISGSDWKQIKLDFLKGRFVRTIKMDPQDRLYIVAQGNKDAALYRSDNQAANWESLSVQSGWITDFTLLDTGGILLATNTAILLSDASQKNYTKVFDDNRVSMQRLFVSNDTAFFWDDVNLYCSVDAGKNWQLSYHLNGYFSSPIVNFNSKFLLADNKEILARDEVKSTWSKVYSFSTLYPNLYHYKNSLIAYGRKGAYTTTDLAHWSKISDNDIRSIYRNDAAIYTTDRYSIMKSSDEGSHWQNILTIPSDDPGPMTVNYRIDILTGTGTTLLAAVSGAGIIKTIDGGNDWQLINDGIEDWNFNSLIAINDNFYVLATMHNIYYTMDGGSHWLPASNEFADNAVELSWDRDNLYAEVNELGIFKTKLMP